MGYEKKGLSEVRVLLKSDSEGGEGTPKIKLSRILSLVDF